MLAVSSGGVLSAFSFGSDGFQLKVPGVKDVVVAGFSEEALVVVGWAGEFRKLNPDLGGSCVTVEGLPKPLKAPEGCPKPFNALEGCPNPPNELLLGAPKPEKPFVAGFTAVSGC
ncbi:hypothetical protein KC351_g15 [Hortaea werneckii]|nr:hypothetical protein KC351_g15 [Hortaea werneckii]